MAKGKPILCPECGVEVDMSKVGGKYSCNNPACSVISFNISNRGVCYRITHCAKPEHERSGSGNDLSSAMNEERIVQKRRERTNS